MSMKKICFILILFILSSCASHKMESAEMSTKSETTPDTIYKGQKENFKYPAARDEEPEMVMSTEEEMSASPTISEIAIIVERQSVIVDDQSPQTTALSLENPISIDDISQGDIMYLIQDSMIVGKINVVNMTISYGIEATEIIAEIETFDDETVYTESIRIAPVMKARLIDVSGDNFKIIPITPEEQFLEFNSYTRWVWNVTPLSEGNHQLSLSVDVVLNDKGKTIEVYDDFIYVYSTQSTISKIWDFIAENWKWFLSSLVLPLFYFLFKIFKKKT